MKKTYNRINKGCTTLFLLLFALTIGLITYEVSNARLVYLDLSKDGKLTMSSVQGARGEDITLRLITVNNLYDIKTRKHIEEEYVEQVLREHLDQYKEDVERWRKL